MVEIAQNFRKLDIFGQQIRLKASGQSVFQTYIGAFMTLLLFSILIYSGILFIIEMNKGKNAIINSQDAVIQNNEGFSFNSTEVIFSAGLLDMMGQPIQNEGNRIFNIMFYVCNKSLNETKCNFIPGTICGERIREASKKLNIAPVYENMTYCMSEEYILKNPTIRFQGSNRYDNFTLLGALIERCKNSTDTSNCASQEEIDRYITNANLYYSYSFHQLNKESEDSPYQKTENIDITSLYNKVGKQVNIYFQYSQSFLEYNPFYFFPEIVQHEGIEYQKTITDSVLYFQDANILARIELQLDAKKKVSYITYQTLMDVVAKLGGLFTIIRALIDILIFPIQSILYSHQNQNDYKDNQKENDKKKKLNIQHLIFSQLSREIFYNQSELINKYLDVRQILIHPLQFTQKIEGLKYSIMKFDLLSSRQTKLITNNNEMDEIVGKNNQEELDQKRLSFGTINSERKIKQIEQQYVFPKRKLPIR